MVSRRSSNIRMVAPTLLALFLIFFVSRLYFNPLHQGPLLSSALRERELRVAEREARAEAALKALHERQQERTTDDERRPTPSKKKTSASRDVSDQTGEAIRETGDVGVAWPLAPLLCARAARRFAVDAAGGEKPSPACGGRGLCNATTGACRCDRGRAGYACDIDLSNLSRDVQDAFAERRFRLDEALRAPSKAGTMEPADNRLVDARGVGELVTVIVPYFAGSGGLLGLKQLIASITLYYPTVQIVVSVSKSGIFEAVETLLLGPREDRRVERGQRLKIVEARKDKSGGLAAAWNGALAAIPAEGSPPLMLFLAPDVVRLHEHTNLELAVSQILTTDVDILGFNTLAPVTDPVAAAASGTGRQTRTPTDAGEYVFISECWNLRHRQWTMRFDRSPFGYTRHEQFVTYCDRTSNSFLARVSFTPRFDGAMRDLAVADFFASIATQNARRVRRYAVGRASFPVTRVPGYVMVGTCSECLLITVVPPADPMTRSADTNATEGLSFAGFLLPSAVDERLHSAFAEKWQVELYFPPTGRIQRNPRPLPSPTGPHSGENDLARPGHGRLVCIKTGGIYGHSQRGLFSPLCHRFGRQRDFLYLASVWMSHSSLPGTRKERRYGVSLHHGNLFGALRMNDELLWETDGDIDFISFDDSHGEMMTRWDAFLQHIQTHAGFEVKVTYPEKPWYVSLLRDKTDFQVNCRGVLSEQTRGKPPQVHNITVWYQGVRCFVNGFQNPWQSVRSDPGHDYRGQYLAQQGWVLNFAKQSIGCLLQNESSGGNGAFAHNACLPSCNDPLNIADHNFCSLDEGKDFSDWRDMQLTHFLE
jgi:hypothetical protein